MFDGFNGKYGTFDKITTNYAANNYENAKKFGANSAQNSFDEQFASEEVRYIPNGLSQNPTANPDSEWENIGDASGLAFADTTLKNIFSADKDQSLTTETVVNHNSYDEGTILKTPDGQPLTPGIAADYDSYDAATKSVSTEEYGRLFLGLGKTTQDGDADSATFNLMRHLNGFNHFQDSLYRGFYQDLNQDKDYTTPGAGKDRDLIKSKIDTNANDKIDPLEAEAVGKYFDTNGDNRIDAGEYYSQMVYADYLNENGNVKAENFDGIAKKADQTIMNAYTAAEIIESPNYGWGKSVQDNLKKTYEDHGLAQKVSDYTPPEEAQTETTPTETA